MNTDTLNVQVPVTLDEQSLVVLIKEALVLAATSVELPALKAAEYELTTLKKHLEMRETEQVLHYKRIGLPESQILEYQQAIHSCRVALENAMVEVQHRKFMLSND